MKGEEKKHGEKAVTSACQRQKHILESRCFFWPSSFVRECERARRAHLLPVSFVDSGDDMTFLSKFCTRRVRSKTVYSNEGHAQKAGQQAPSRTGVREARGLLFFFGSVFRQTSSSLFVCPLRVGNSLKKEAEERRFLESTSRQCQHVVREPTRGRQTAPRALTCVAREITNHFLPTDSLSFHDRKSREKIQLFDEWG